MARKYAINPPPDVKVHHKNGCGACGRTDAHTHTQAEHQRQVDKAEQKGGR